MTKRITASDAKNNFGGLLDEVAASGRVDVMKHGRLTAVVLSPQHFERLRSGQHGRGKSQAAWDSTHMIPAEAARAARIVSEGAGFDDD